MIVNRKFAENLHSMIGLLKEKNEIEKLQQEYKKLAARNFKVTAKIEIEIAEEEVALEESEAQL